MGSVYGWKSKLGQSVLVMVGWPESHEFVCHPSNVDWLVTIVMQSRVNLFDKQQASWKIPSPFVGWTALAEW